MHCWAVLPLPSRGQATWTVAGKVRFCTVNKRVRAFRRGPAVRPWSWTGTAGDESEFAGTSRPARQTRLPVFTQPDDTRLIHKKVEHAGAVGAEPEKLCIRRARFQCV